MMGKAKERMKQGIFVPGVDPGLQRWLKMRKDVRDARLKGSNTYTVTSDMPYKFHYHWIDVLHSFSEEDFQKIVKSNQESDELMHRIDPSNVCTFTEYETLLKDANRDHEKIYYFAVQHRSLVLVKTLIERERLNPNYLFTPHKRTLLHLATVHGDLEKVKYLLEHGADSNSCDANNRTPLHLAIQPDSVFHSPEIASLIIQHGGLVNARDSHGRTPLHYACLVNSANLSKILLENKADMTVEDEHRKTPLSYNRSVSSPLSEISSVLLCYNECRFPFSGSLLSSLSITVENNSF
jgi:hypothetical protein